MGKYYIQSQETTNRLFFLKELLPLEHKKLLQIDKTIQKEKFRMVYKGNFADQQSGEGTFKEVY